MRCTIALGMALTVTTVVGQAAGYDPNCVDTMAGPACQMRAPSCEAPPLAPEQPPRAPEQPLAPQQSMLAAPQAGMFVQPPANGTVRGPSEERTMEGAALTFHGLTLRLPSLRMPSWTHSRSNARMDIEASSAPYVPGYPMAAMPVAMAPQMMLAPQAPTEPQQAPQPPPDAPAAPRAPACDAPQGPYRAPSCDAYGRNAAVDEKLRSIEAAERRLAARIEELQQLAARLDVNSAATPLTPVSVGTAPANFGPIRPPGQMPGNPAPFGAQRTSYVEPSPLPAELRVVREPQAPTCRITGMRGR